MGLKLQDVRFRLGAAFAVLLAVLAVFGWESVSRLHRLNAQIQNAVYVRWTEEELVREAFRLSNLNNRITLVIFLLDDQEEIQRLLAERAANTQHITELIQAIKPTLRTDKEKGLLTAVETARTPYIESHLKTLELLLTEHKRDEARRMMIEVTLPRLTIYHDAWLAFVRLQAGEIERAAQRNKASFAAAQRGFLFLTVFAGLVTIGIVILVFVQVNRGIAALQHERDLLEGRVQDRTAELEEASKKSQASEARYRALFESSSDAIMTLDANHFLDCNSATLKMFGCASKKEFIAFHPADLSPPRQPSGQDSRTASDQHITEALAKGTASFEWMHRRCNGEDFPADLLLTALEANGQKILQATVRDISERKRAEETIARLASFPELNPNPIVEVDQAGRVHYVNPAARLLFPDLVERGLRHPWLAGLESVGSALQTGQTRSAVREVTVGDRHYQQMVHYVEESQRSRIYGHDITEHRRAEEQLHLRSEAMQAAANGIVITDGDGKIEWANNAFTRLTGYTAAEVVGQNPRFLKSGQHDAAYYRKMWDTIRAGQVWHGELVNKRKDGSFYTEEMTITPVAGGSGGTSHFIGIKQDVTARLQLEEELRQAHKMEAVGRLAGGVAHDFNNILTAIIGYGERTMQLLRPDEPQRKNIKQITDAAERAAVLTRQLLAFGRKQVFQPMVLDMNVVIAGMAQMLQGLVGEDIELTTVLAPGLGHTRADQNQIEQVLLNLVINSRDAMPGKGRLTIETANVEPDAEYVRQNPEMTPGPCVMFAVTDTGSGMTDAVKQHLFEPFFTTKEVGKGTGMGLATCFGIIKQSGGHISVHSDPGMGTTVRVYLPRVEAPTAVKREPPTGEPPRGTETILLAEDEPVLRDLARMVLSDLGYTVLEAEDGEAALRLIQEKKHPALNLLLSDIMMPRMGGMALAAKLRTDYPRIKILFISGYSAEVIARKGVFEPGTTFLAKPFTPSALARKVRETLDS